MKTNLLISFLLFAFLASGQKDREIIKQIDSINTSALNFYNNNDIVRSFTEFNKAKELSESYDDDYGKIVANHSLGKIYVLMCDYEAAEKSFNAMLAASKAINDYCLLASSNLSLGKLYKEKQLVKESIQYYEKALEYLTKKERLECEEEETKAILFDTRIGLSEVFLDNDELDKALFCLLQIEKGLDSNSFKVNSEANYNYIYGLYYLKKELYNNANAKFSKVIELLSDKTSDLKLLSNTYKQLSLLSSKLENNQEAYTFLLKHNYYKDKLINEQKAKQEIVTKSKFLIEDYKNNAQLANNERLHQLEITKKIKNINIGITITLLLLFVSIITLYKSYVSKRKLSDILKIKNEDLEKAKNEALKSSELKSKFISNVSHELRTPLYGVVGLSSLLLNNNNLSKRDSKYLKSLKYSGDYLLNLVNDILQIGKMEAEKIELKNVSVNLKSMLEGVVNSFNYKLHETNNKIEIFIDNYVPEHIKCDQIRLSQILINLIGNSVKFTQSGTINLRVILLSRTRDEEVTLRFEIEDDGIGIPQEKFATIFDNFTQVGDESNINYQGTGLGLSITRNLIELFESKIELESELGKGTKISFNVDFEIDNKIIKPYNDGLKHKESKPQGGKYRVLVAEDNKINQIVTKNLLVKQNYECTIANNGTEVLDAMKKNEFDLILMDINMPIMNGNETTLAIRKFNTRIPIIALTAADIDDIKHDYENIGYDGVITKPFDNYDFFQMITTSIQNKQSEENIELVIAS